MCGIFGVWGHQRAAALTHLGLYSLQHRGQESAGIVAVGPDGVARSVRKMGLVSEGFSANDVAPLQGSLAIGHTRYSTAGGSLACNAQPIVVRDHETGEQIALAHNGNLTNAAVLRHQLGDLVPGEYAREMVNRYPDLAGIVRTSVLNGLGYSVLALTASVIARRLRGCRNLRFTEIGEQPHADRRRLVIGRRAHVLPAGRGREEEGEDEKCPQWPHASLHRWSVVSG